MVDKKELYSSFEDLSEQIVKHIFKGTGSYIEKTRANKDGGYDIIVEYSTGHKVYFECKYRSKNMNLRDIAANVIIAHNKGAVAMVAFTNHDFTLQADEHLSRFIEKTVLNIKIIVGEDINHLLKKYDINVSDTLSKLIKPLRTYKKRSISVLQIDFTKNNIHEQFIHPLLIGDNIDKPQDLTCGKQAYAFTILQDGGALLVSGFAGVGKREFVSSVSDTYNGKPIWIDASLYLTKEQILVDVLLSIWGISTTKIFEEFTNAHIDLLIENLSERISNPKTLEILRRLFGDNRISGVNDEDYNLLICNYISELLEMHQKSFPYLLILENLAYANDEIYTLVSYLIKRVSNKKIPCIIIQDKEEYEAQRSIDFQAVFGSLPSFTQMTLEAFTKNDAINYIRNNYHSIPEIIANEIVNHVGTRKANLLLFMKFISNLEISTSDYKRISIELQTLQPNSIPTIMSKVLNYYKQQDASELLNLMHLLNGKISEQLCRKITVDHDFLENLFSAGILLYYRGYYIFANRIISAVINEWSNVNSLRTQYLATDILKVIEAESNICTPDEHARLLACLRSYDQAINVLLPYIAELENEYQLDALIDAIDILIELYSKTNNYYLWSNICCRYE